MRRRTNAVFLCAVAVAVAACSSSPTKKPPVRVIERQAARIQIQQDPGGFSIIEEVERNPTARFACSNCSSTSKESRRS
jgi:uncharacterized lipoprotein